MGVRTGDDHPILQEINALYQRKEVKSGCAAAHPAHPVPPPLINHYKLKAGVLFIALVCNTKLGGIFSTNYCFYNQSFYLQPSLLWGPQ